MDGYCTPTDPQELWKKELKTIEPWYIKFKSGRLKEVPREILDEQKMRVSRHQEWADVFSDYTHPAIKAFIMYKYEDYSPAELLGLKKHKTIKT